MRGQGLAAEAPACQTARMSAEDSDRTRLIELANYRMPFGKYKGRLLVDLPEPYVVWFSRKGFPRGKLGDLLKEIYEIKVNGLEHLLQPLRTPGNP
jgi:uncharacterized protein (DUF3820 family)